MTNLIDSGWSAWLPFELIDALAARDGGSAERRAFRKRLERGPSDDDRERWQRFALVCPSRIDLPDEDDLDEEGAQRVLEDLGLLDERPPEAVELVLTLDHDDVREPRGDPRRPRRRQHRRGAARPARARKRPRRREDGPQRPMPVRLR